jgi:hypothetical protein
MTSMASRPTGITVIAVLLILVGVVQLIIAATLLDWVSVAPAPASGDPQVSGWAALVVGAIDLAVGVGLFTLKRWAWIVALMAAGLTVGAAAWALARHGLDGVVWVSALSGVVAFIVLAYLLQGNARAAFEA